MDSLDFARWCVNLVTTLRSILRPCHIKLHLLKSWRASGVYHTTHLLLSLFSAAVHCRLTLASWSLMRILAKAFRSLEFTCAFLGYDGPREARPVIPMQLFIVIVAKWRQCSTTFP